MVWFSFNSGLLMVQKAHEDAGQTETLTLSKFPLVPEESKSLSSYLSFGVLPSLVTILQKPKRANYAKLGGTGLLAQLLGKLTQEDCKSKTCLGYRSSRLAPNLMRLDLYIQTSLVLMAPCN